MSTSYKTSHQSRQIFIHPVSESHQCCSAAYFHFVCSTHSELAGAAALPEVRRRQWLTECRKLNSSNKKKLSKVHREESAHHFLLTFCKVHVETLFLLPAAKRQTAGDLVLAFVCAFVCLLAKLTHKGLVRF